MVINIKINYFIIGFSYFSLNPILVQWQFFFKEITQSSFLKFKSRIYKLYYKYSHERLSELFTAINI